MHRETSHLESEVIETTDSKVRYVKIPDIGIRRQNINIKLTYFKN